MERRLSRRTVGLVQTGLWVALAFWPAPAQAARQQLSQDRDLKELNLASWDCLNRMEGTAKTPDGMERNRLKNRSAPDGPVRGIVDTNVAGFLQHIADFEGMSRNARRKDINPAQRQTLEPLEKHILTVTGYIQLFYCGPPESTNCGSGEFHDWHLEVMDKPIDHPPQAGDQTPIVCEITPRTQNAIYKDGIRLQELGAFFRRPDMSYEPTGHKPVKVRITGYLLWDDEHNGTADVGTSIRTAPPMKYHNPWRQAAWEVHPVYKIERADGAHPPPPPETAVAPAAEKNSSTPAPTEAVSPSPGSGAVSPADAPTPLPPPPTPPQMVTVQIALKIPTAQGETIIPRGTKLPVTSRDGVNVTVQYNGQTVIIPNGYVETP